uniref:hypothetical protein n=1 Tax=Ekhidna sp. TaxID=2608089 RepID=UPI0032EFEF57
MDPKLYSRLLKVSLFLLPFLAMAQEWEEVKKHSLKKTATAYSADIQGNFFIGYTDGSLEKRNANGDLLENFALSNNSPISLIDVQNNLRPFLFYFDNQQITILDRFSSVPKIYQLSDLGTEIGMMACPSPDGDIWVLENNPQRLKKINPLRKSTILEAQISIGDNIRKMQAYQNFLFIADEQGLHFFDQFGGFVQSLKIEGMLNFQVSSGMIHAFTSSMIHQIDINKGEFNSSIKLPYEISGGLKLNDQYLLIDEKELAYYKLID